MRLRPLVLVSIILPVIAGEQPANMRGYLNKDVAEEQKVEQEARAIPDSTRLRQDLEYLAAHPHHAGSPGSKANAEHILGMMQGWGLDAHIEHLKR